MNDEPNVNHFMNGYQDAEQFTGETPPSKPVHRVNSGRVDPHLTRYVGVEAAAELRALCEEMLEELYQRHDTIIQEFETGDHFFSNLFEKTRSDFRARLNDILGLHE